MAGDHSAPQEMAIPLFRVSAWQLVGVLLNQVGDLEQMRRAVMRVHVDHLPSSKACARL